MKPRAGPSSATPSSSSRARLPLLQHDDSRSPTTVRSSSSHTLFNDAIETRLDTRKKDAKASLPSLSSSSPFSSSPSLSLSALEQIQQPPLTKTTPPNRNFRQSHIYSHRARSSNVRTRALSSRAKRGGRLARQPPDFSRSRTRAAQIERQARRPSYDRGRSLSLPFCLRARLPSRC